MPDAGTTARIARRPAGKFDAFRQGRLPLQRDDTPPPPLPCPRGNLQAATTEQIQRASTNVWGNWNNRDGQRQAGIRTLLTHLARFDGQTWQQRWIAAGLDEVAKPVVAISDGAPETGTLTTALAALLALRVITPSLAALRSNRILDYPETFRTAQSDPILDDLFAKAGQLIAQNAARQEALHDITVALTTQGIALAGLTPGRFLAYVLDSRTHVVTAARHRRKRYRGHHAWELLCRTGHFPPDTPTAMKEAIREPRLTPAQLVARYHIADTAVEHLIIDYLTIRAADIDYSSLRTLASYLANLFWKQIETLAPDQHNLNLPGDLYEQWRKTLCWRQNGQVRTEQDTILMAVRSFYYDLSTWALQEPQRWAAWVAPCPVPQRELRGAARRRRKVSERMADRTRQRQPLLPRLVEQVEQNHALYTELLRVGEAAGAGEQIAVAGRTWIRVLSKHDRRRQREHGRANVRLRDTATGKVVHVDREEERTFWEWAIVETLRHSGIRIEELLELSQLSIRQYRRPSGEVIALLVVAPSKTDRERVIPMSAELFAVLAAIIRRHTRAGGSVPVVSRYDPHERETLPALPYLFQRPARTGPAVISAGTAVRALQRLCIRIADADPVFTNTVFTPHDFRRLFATELVNSGLPIHIGAALLGHLDVATTRGYVAVFDEDVVRHYQEFLHRRRAQRPAEEYRPVTEGEWTEFEDHFDRRKVELGSCARPYGTGCQHEHACLRCPVLLVDPKMLPRLKEIEFDLLSRRTRANSEGWLGEIEGIDLTLIFLRDKTAQTERTLARGATVPLGLPTTRT